MNKINTTDDDQEQSNDEIYEKDDYQTNTIGTAS